jgi:hypothetical protein
LINPFGLEIFDIEKFDVHGGSLRIFVSKKNNFKISNSVEKFIDEEINFGLNNFLIYEKFAIKVYELKKNLKKILLELKNENKCIFGYGASAKGNVLLNFCDIGNEFLDFIIDTTPLKQGKYTPGTHIPIISPEKILERGKNDVALLLAWNYADSILKKEELFRKNGGKFLIPVPEPHLK